MFNYQTFMWTLNRNLRDILDAHHHSSRFSKTDRSKFEIWKNLLSPFAVKNKIGNSWLGEVWAAIFWTSNFDLPLALLQPLELWFCKVTLFNVHFGDLLVKSIAALFGLFKYAQNILIFTVLIQWGYTSFLLPLHCTFKRSSWNDILISCKTFWSRVIKNSVFSGYPANF